MNDDRTNLLPLERQHALSREYILRLGVVAGLIVFALTCIAGLLLVPTYVFLTKSIEAKQANLANVESAVASSDEKDLLAHLALLSSDTVSLLALSNTVSASAVISAALAIPHAGVRLSRFSYTPLGTKTPGMLTISGIAETRDALRSYQLLLQNAPFAAAADLPVSAYAKDSDIAFTITVILAP